MRAAVFLIAIIAASVGCSRQVQHNKQTSPSRNEAQLVPQPRTLEAYKSPQGVSYAVDRVSGFKTDNLPMNSEFKMADGDLGKYAETACVLNVPPKTAPSRCDIYVQSDPNGTLIGYAAVTEDADGVRFNTITTLNEKKQPGGGPCYISGKLFREGANWKQPVRDGGKDFNGQFAYSAWEKDRDVYLVSPATPDREIDTSTNGAMGTWNVEKKGDKLRIYQERWNYCYRNSSVNVDDVYYRGITLVRKDT